MRMPQGEAPVVLIAEDEPGLLDVLAQCLKGEGYTVLTASDGVRAMAMLEARDTPVDLLVADVRMPGLGGDQLALAATDRRLARRVLLTSGYDFRADAFQRVGPFLPKPFTPDVFLRTVSELLDRSV